MSRAVKPLVEDARPPDYFSQKACNYIVYATSPSESSVLMGEVCMYALYCIVLLHVELCTAVFCNAGQGEAPEVSIHCVSVYYL